MGLMFLSRRKNRRSNINFSNAQVSDIGVGTIYPFMMFDVSKGDIVRFQPSTFLQAFSLRAPLVNGFKLCLEYFFAPNRLYHGKLLLNERDVTSDPSKVVFPSVRLMSPSFSDLLNMGADDGSIYIDFRRSVASSDLPERPMPGEPSEPNASMRQAFNALSRYMVQPGSFADFMGFPVGWFPTRPGSPTENIPSELDDTQDGFFLNVTKALAYLDIILNYYANQQIDYLYTSGYVTRDAGYGPSEPGWGRPSYGENVVEQVKCLYNDLHSFLNGLKRSENPSQFLASWIENESYQDTTFCTWSWLCSPFSLFQRSFPSYYLESWLKTSYGDAIGSTIKVDVTDSSVSFVDIRAASHFQRYFELSMAGGSRYTDYENAQFDASRLRNTVVPIFLGSDRKMLGSNIIYQTTGFENSESPLGAFAGQMAGGDKFKERSFKIGEDGVFFVFATLMPDTIYYRGIEPSLRRLRLDDFYTPALDNLGYQPLRVSEVDALPPVVSQNLNDTESVDSEGKTGYWRLTLGRDDPDGTYSLDRALGFVPAWSDIMQKISRVHGSLQDELKYWTLVRDYSSSPLNKDLRFFIDYWLEDYLINEVGSNGGNYGRFEALRTFFNNIRSEGSYVPYVQNHLFNSVFADNSPYARNFVLTLTADITINREKSKANIPNTL